jgi:hypothetical protein
MPLASLLGFSKMKRKHRNDSNHGRNGFVGGNPRYNGKGFKKGDRAKAKQATLVSLYPSEGAVEVQPLDLETAMLEYNQLTAAQRDAVAAWETANNDNNEYEYSDNRRYAVPGNAEQEAAYEQIKNDGCCGFCDVELQCSDGSTLWYGFNWGH